jgi:hypothetical protein
MNLIRHGLGVTAVIGGLVLGWFALTLAGLGMFCFDGALFAELNDRTSLAPDCFVIGVSDWVNPRLWLLANVFVAIVLSIWAQAIAYGLLRSRSWSRTSLSVGTFTGILYFLEIATALPEFRTSSIVGVAALACFTLGYLVVLKPATPA